MQNALVDRVSSFSGKYLRHSIGLVDTLDSQIFDEGRDLHATKPLVAFLVQLQFRPAGCHAFAPKDLAFLNAEAIQSDLDPAIIRRTASHPRERSHNGLKVCFRAVHCAHRATGLGAKRSLIFGAFWP